MDSSPSHIQVADAYQCPSSRKASYDEEKTINSHVLSKDDQDVGFKMENPTTLAPIPQSDLFDRNADEYPDGGLRAWLVVIGVGDIYYYFRMFFTW